MNNDGVETLRIAIVTKAVQDYNDCLKKIDRLQDKEKAREKVVKDAARARHPKKLPESMIEFERERKIKELHDQIIQLERFFHSDWYAELCEINGDYMIKKIRERYVRNKKDGKKG